MMKYLIVVITAITILIGAGFYAVQRYFLADNILSSSRNINLKIPSGSSFSDVMSLLRQKKALRDESTFVFVCNWKDYPSNIKSGNYTLRTGMNNREIVNLLKGGLQSPVQLVIYNVRTKEDFAGLIGRTLELDSTHIIAQLNSPAFCARYETDTNNILTRFIVANYELYWNISVESFFEKLDKAYHNFWNADRLAAAKSLNYTPQQVTTLASIVEKEVIFDKEMPTVAGVYLNRLRIGMPLQADPTLVFARKDFTAKRVTAFHKSVISKYNTYMNSGLPPGPICMPRKKSIDAVLNAEKHSYLYFCANPDMSGYSIFSETYAQQMKVAAQYRKKLNTLNIH